MNSEISSSAIQTLATMLNNVKVNPQEAQYLEMMLDVKTNGKVKTDRTGTGTTSQFGKMMRFNLQEGFPLLTTKKIHLKSIIHELIWFLTGDTNIKYLTDNGVNIWNEWADANGDLGPVYGRQWRNWQTHCFIDTPTMGVPREEFDAYLLKISTLESNGWRVTGNATPEKEGGPIRVILEKTHDQIAEVLDLLKNNPDSRRIIVSAWNVGELSQMKLMPCHSLFQFYTTELTNNERLAWIRQQDPDDLQMDLRGFCGDILKEKLNARGVPQRRLSCQLYQRSADVFLGVPFNIASYAMLTHMFAQQLNMVVGDFVWTGGDVHIYSNHTEQVDLQLNRAVRPLPQLIINRKPHSIFDYKFEDFEIVNYHPHPGIKAPVAV